MPLLLMMYWNALGINPPSQPENGNAFQRAKINNYGIKKKNNKTL